MRSAELFWGCVLHTNVELPKDLTQSTIASRLVKFATRCRSLCMQTQTTCRALDSDWFSSLVVFRGCYCDLLLRQVAPVILRFVIQVLKLDRDDSRKIHQSLAGRLWKAYRPIAGDIWNLPARRYFYPPWRVITRPCRGLLIGIQSIKKWRFHSTMW